MAKAEAEDELEAHLDQEVNKDDILVADRYQVFPDQPAPEFNQPGGKAFIVRDHRLPMRQLVGRVSDADTIPRFDVMITANRLHDTNIMQPVGWGPVHWTPEKRDSFAVIFDRPEVGPIMKSKDDRIVPMTSDSIIRNVLEPSINTLALFVRHGQTHRSIRPDNMYYETEGSNHVIIGDCCSVPPGWNQPVMLETIEMGMTPAYARGRGSVLDDLYALGASILFLALGNCPVARMSDDQILDLKVRHGSFAALLNGQSPPSGLREVIRGMLTDKPDDRWRVEDVQRWLAGEMRRAVQPGRELTSDRPFEFAGESYRECRTLAHAFGMHWQAAAHVTKTSELENWVVRGVSDSKLSETMKETLFVASRSSDYAGEGRLLTQICMVLDPTGPIRHNGIRVMPEGLGVALAWGFMAGKKDLIQRVAEVIARALPYEWFRNRALHQKEDFSAALRIFKRLQQLLKPAAPGYGVERVLYELGPYVPCLAPSLKSRYVTGTKDLIRALEEIVTQNGKIDTLVDRHLVGFIAARMTGKIESQLAVLENAGGDSLKAKLAMVSMLAAIQKESGPDSVPNFTRWLIREISPAMDRYYSASLRQQVRKALNAIANNGSIVEIHRIVNNHNLLDKDKGRRASAVKEYARAEIAAQQLESREFEAAAQQTGWSIAASISGGIAALTVSLVLMW